MSPTIRLDLVFVGFGHVARRFVTLLQEQQPRLEARVHLDWRVVGIATAHHGQLVDPDGVDVQRALIAMADGGSLGGADRCDPSEPRGHPHAAGSTPDTAFIEQVSRTLSDGTSREQLVFIETTPLNVKTGQPAINHIRAALQAGGHVITANKGPIAFAYRELSRLADLKHRSLLFEGTVMDGIPLFNFVRETLPGVDIVGFRGVVNSTTNYILTAMEHGQDFDAALTEMQRAGIAEADPSLDVDGWDAAAKTAALANVLMHGDLTPQAVAREGIGAITRADIEAAARRGQRIRLVARAERGRTRGQETLSASVRPEALDMANVLATLKGMENALVLKTDLLGEIAVAELEAGLTQTAYALLTDLVTVRKGLSR